MTTKTRNLLKTLHPTQKSVEVGLNPAYRLKIKTKGETKRDRRITPQEEQKLLAATDKMSSV